MADLAPLGDLAARALRRRRAGRQGGARARQQQLVLDRASRRSRSPTRRACVDSMTVAAALDLEAFARQPHDAPPAGRRDAPLPGPARRARRACAPRSRAATCGSAGRRAQPPGPALLPLLVQIRGATRDALAFARAQLAIELNAHHDNPLVLAGEDRMSRSAATTCCRWRRRSTSCGSRSRPR